MILCFHIHGERPSEQEGWIDCIDWWTSHFLSAIVLFEKVSEAYSTVFLHLELYEDEDTHKAPLYAFEMLPGEEEQQGDTTPHGE